jgi:hypothetical protein
MHRLHRRGGAEGGDFSSGNQEIRNGDAGFFAGAFLFIGRLKKPTFRHFSRGGPETLRVIY